VYGFALGFASNGNFKHQWHHKLDSSVGAVLIGHAGIFSVLLLVTHFIILYAAYKYVPQLLRLVWHCVRNKAENCPNS
jgi:hypothetical protein